MIAILDYGSGNLRSAERAFATSGKDVVVTSDRAVALEAEGLVVPGVGAFAACMNGLNAVDGAAIVRERLAKERPTLGICIGMQILFSQGTEHSESAAHAGVGIWDGVISKLDAPILPHMGWNTVETNPDSILFKGYEFSHPISEVTGLPRLKYHRDRPYEKYVPYYKTYVAKSKSHIPDFYVLGGQNSRVLERLKANQFKFEVLQKDTVIQLGSVRIEKFETSKTAYEGHYAHSNVSSTVELSVDADIMFAEIPLNCV